MSSYVYKKTISETSTSTSPSTASPVVISGTIQSTPIQGVEKTTTTTVTLPDGTQKVVTKVETSGDTEPKYVDLENPEVKMQIEKAKREKV